ncbi:MAG TPA: T9SS type A sorting domain-containing protein [Chitinophagaceae bacterium]|nr:T9SS type A sorting domain-containing protein [Chitinophagaceae bacterium]
MKKRLMGALIVLFAITSLPAQQITRAEYFFNTDPGQGLATAFSITAGDSVIATNNISIPANLPAGINLLFVRVSNNYGTWSFPEVNLLWISGAAKKINSLEYFFDADPGFGNGTRVSFPLADSINLSQNVIVPDSLKGGSHILFVRVQNEGGSWSMPEAYLISVANGFLPVSGAEYFFDTDPGIGLATPLNIATADSIILIQNIPVPALTIGAHYLYVRVKNPKGTWSFPEVSPVNICTVYGPKSFFSHYINGSEVYFTDSSTNSVSREWLFGDNTSDTSSNPRHVYAAGNNYTVKFITMNSCGNDTLTKIIGIAGVQSILPANAPATGIYIGYIKGVGFKNGTTVSWSKAGSPVIYADTTIFVDSTSLKVIFKNKNEVLGIYNLQADVPGTGQMTLDTAIRIEPATPSDIWVRLEGRREVLINRWSSFQIVFGNNGNQTAVGVPILVKLPKNIQAKIINPVIDSFVVPAVLNELPEGRFYLVRDSIANDSLMVGYFDIPYLEPGMTGSLTLEVKSTSSAPFVIKTMAEKSLYDDTAFITGKSINRETSFCDPPPCIKCLLDIIGLTPAGCVPAVYNFACSADNALGGAIGGGTSCTKSVLDMTGNFGGMVLSCFGGSAIGAIKIAGDMVNNGTGGFSAFGNCMDCFPHPPMLDTIRTRFSWDPNVKTGPGGYNNLNYTRWQDPFNYSIHFENLASATAPASEVVVTDYLDTTKLDMSSLKFTGFGFADTSIRFTIPDTLFIRDIDLRPAKNAIVRVTGKLDSVNKLSFRFTTFDPLTMKLTASINDGFLEPDTDGIRGLGYVSFRANVKPDLPTGTIVNNTASVVFDNNAPLATTAWFNGIDKEKPASNVLPITERLNDTTYKIHWTGSDAHAGIYRYRIMVSVNDSAYQEWIVTDSTVANFTVHVSNIYKFYSIAEDWVGNIEDTPGVPDQVLAVALPVTLVEFNAYKQNKTSVLRWTTNFEQNNRGFEIQRSSDGIHFSRIGWVAGLGNSSSLHTYFFTDSTPLNGKNFYRLNQIDLDNHTKLSEVRKVDFEQLIDFNVYPNPATHVLNVQFGSNIMTVKITDLQGRLLWTENANGSLQILIPVQQLPDGLYMLEVSDRNGNRRLQKFIKASR